MLLTNEICSFKKNIIARLSSSGKIAIAVSVVSMILILSGITMALLYCRRKQYTTHEPALVNSMEDGYDDNIL